MASSDAQSDSGRNEAPRVSKAAMSHQYVPPSCKGDFLPAYGGGMGAVVDWPNAAEEAAEGE